MHSRKEAKSTTPSGSSGDAKSTLTSESSPEKTLMPALTSILERLTMNPQTQPSCSVMHGPQPERFDMGGDFALWELETRVYLRQFPPERRNDVILSLLTGEAFLVAARSKVFSHEFSEATFDELRKLLDTPFLPVEYRQQFKTRKQREGESVRNFAWALVELVKRGYGEESSEAQEARVLEQFTEGVSGRSARRKFILQPPATVDEAIEQALELEKLDAATDQPAQQCCVAWRPRHYNRRSCGNYRRPLHNRRYNHSRGFTPQRRHYGAATHQGNHFSTSFVPAVSVINSVTPFMVSILIGGISTSALIDTGASRSLVRWSLVKRFKDVRFRQCNDLLLSVLGGYPPNYFLCLTMQSR